MIYKTLADELLKKFVEYKNNKTNYKKVSGACDYVYKKIDAFGDFGIDIRFDYQGLMAMPQRGKKYVKKPQEGLFDFKICTGSFLENQEMTHRLLFSKVVQNSSLENCYKVWRGEFPEKIAKNDTELATLITLALSFFEQEVNWGKENWQRNSNFIPDEKAPKKVRPRDMLMGYICQSYDYGVDNIKYWQSDKSSTPKFSPPNEKKYYSEYPEEYKKYFTQLENDDIAEALMIGAYKNKFSEVAKMYDDTNPRYFSLAGSKRKSAF